MARIPRITSKADLPEDKRHIFDAIVESHGSIGAPFQLLLYSPELAWRTSELRRYLFFESSLTLLDRNLAILLAARESDCEYVWSIAAGWAIETGARQELIDVIGHRRPLDSLTEEEALIVGYAREVLHNHRVSEATFEAARARYGNMALTDLTAMLGYYTMVGYILNTFGVEATPGLPRLP